MAIRTIVGRHGSGGMGWVRTNVRGREGGAESPLMHGVSVCRLCLWNACVVLVCVLVCVCGDSVEGAWEGLATCRRNPD